jgi:hypothetical protein
MTSSPERNAAAHERATKALELRLAGASYDRIAAQLGYEGKSGAYHAVQRALREAEPPGAEATELTELARLDAMLTGLWPKARRGEVTAVDRVLKIEERRDQILAREQVRADDPPEGTTERTGLSEFERRLRERESGADVPHRPAR